MIKSIQLTNEPIELYKDLKIKKSKPVVLQNMSSREVYIAESFDEINKNFMCLMPKGEIGSIMSLDGHKELFLYTKDLLGNTKIHINIQVSND